MSALQAIHDAANLIHEADALIIAAGAGMSVDSGLPDFRGSNGLWTSLLPRGMREQDLGSFTQANCFSDDPLAAWRFYGRALQVCNQSAPHAGYNTLLRWSNLAPRGAFVYTSNVDGHFQRAGFSDHGIVECHGSIHFLQCAKPCSPAIWAAKGLADALGDIDRLTLAGVPRCIKCGALARPNFMMFGDATWCFPRTGAQLLSLDIWRKGMGNAVAIEIGAGVAIPAVRMFAEGLGIPLIRINLHDAGGGSGSTIALRGSALEVLSRIDDALTGGKTSTSTGGAGFANGLTRASGRSMWPVR
jgi:NAD-dependent SIR2 family protein deacetylase